MDDCEENCFLSSYCDLLSKRFLSMIQLGSDRDFHFQKHSCLSILKQHIVITTNNSMYMADSVHVGLGTLWCCNNTGCTNSSKTEGQNLALWFSRYLFFRSIVATDSQELSYRWVSQWIYRCFTDCQEVMIYQPFCLSLEILQ